MNKNRTIAFEDLRAAISFDNAEIFSCAEKRINLLKNCGVEVSEYDWSAHISYIEYWIKQENLGDNVSIDRRLESKPVYENAGNTNLAAPKKIIGQCPITVSGLTINQDQNIKRFVMSTPKGNGSGQSELDVHHYNSEFRLKFLNCKFIREGHADSSGPGNLNSGLSGFSVSSGALYCLRTGDSHEQKTAS